MLIFFFTFILNLIYTLLIFFFFIFIINRYTGKCRVLNNVLENQMNDFVKDLINLQFVDITDVSIIMQMLEFISFYLLLNCVFLLWVLGEILIYIKIEKTKPKITMHNITSKFKEIMALLYLCFKIMKKFLNIHVLLYKLRTNSILLKQDIGFVFFGLVSLYLGTYIYEYLFLNDIELYIKNYDEYYRLYCLTNHMEYDSFRQQTLYSYWRISFKAQTYTVFTVRSVLVGLGSYMIFSLVRAHFDGDPKGSGSGSANSFGADRMTEGNGFVGSVSPDFLFTDNTTDSNSVLIQEPVNVQISVDQVVKSISNAPYNLFKLATQDVKGYTTYASLFHNLQMFTSKQIEINKAIQKASEENLEQGCITRVFKDFFFLLEKIEQVLELRTQMHELQELSQNLSSPSLRKEFAAKRDYHFELVEQHDIAISHFKKALKRLKESQDNKVNIQPRLDNDVKILSVNHKDMILYKLNDSITNINALTLEAAENVIIVVLNRVFYRLVINGHINVRTDNIFVMVEKMDFPFIISVLKRIGIPCTKEYLYEIFRGSKFLKYGRITPQTYEDFCKIEKSVYDKHSCLVDKQEELNNIKSKLINPVGLGEEEDVTLIFHSFKSEEFYKLLEVISDTFC